MAGFVPPGTTLLGNEATSEAAKKINEVHRKVDYLNLPCPIPYEELHREALMSLKPEYFEGMRFDFTKGLNQKFSLSHSVMMGPMEIPSQSSEAIKIPTAHYEFGANFIDQKTMLIGRVLTDGRVNARVKCDLTDDLALKANAQLTNEPHMSHVMLNFDYKGKDYRSQLQLGNGALFGASYIQSVTPHMSLGAEVFWAGQHRKSGVGYAGRYETDKMVIGLALILYCMSYHCSIDVFEYCVAAGQVASTGLMALSYVQKVSEKVSLATDFMYNYLSKDVTASVGYDYALRQARLRGKIDSNGCTSAFLEERLNMGLNFVLSAELDHKKKDYKFGFGLTVG
ncbi:mitochondrial import receptor subunit TOM40-1-like [Populus alba x Populus x berolinensis]|uniref:Mitochondrial import receptor subunit TOM40-1-like n=1 Tax=Populus alba x Populus x berolinensis TaxID=444605 RepID=A0AAD6LQU8_9ROSI|nr:mitochondrial import receptor subunit TOM40-1-like [Populus alba x Populus x berolinensis]